MPSYLVHQTAAGAPVGVYTESFDYYDPKHVGLRLSGREMVYGKLPSASWEDFIERLASTTPSATMRWDTYSDSSTNLRQVLEHAQRDTERTGDPEPE